MKNRSELRHVTRSGRIKRGILMKEVERKGQRREQENRGGRRSRRVKQRNMQERVVGR